MELAFEIEYFESLDHRSRKTIYTIIFIHLYRITHREENII